MTPARLCAPPPLVHQHSLLFDIRVSLFSSYFHGDRSHADCLTESRGRAGALRSSAGPLRPGPAVGPSLDGPHLRRLTGRTGAVSRRSGPSLAGPSRFAPTGLLFVWPSWSHHRTAFDRRCTPNAVASPPRTTSIKPLLSQDSASYDICSCGERLRRQSRPQRPRPGSRPCRAPAIVAVTLRLQGRGREIALRSTGS